MPASPQIAKALDHPVLHGPAVVPDGCLPVLVQEVLECVDGPGLLHIVRKRVIITDNSVTEDMASLFMLEIPWPDGMVPTCILLPQMHYLTLAGVEMQLPHPAPLT